MTTPAPGEEPMDAHELLLRMAGRVPDSTLVQARRMLADGAARSAIAFLARSLADAPVPLTAGELDALRSLACDPGALSGAEPADEPPALPFTFSELDADGEARRDDLDEAVVAVAQAYGEGLSGVWRAWRYAAPVASTTRAVEATPNPLRPYRVYLVQVEDPALAQRLAAGLLTAVPDPASAGAEIIRLGAVLPPYQRAALSGALLLWATVNRPEFTVARVFDFADPVTGPGFEPDHALIDDLGERADLLGYLRGGYPVLTTLARMNDILDPAAGQVVPGSFRTDGVWIWTDTVAYYLDRHGIAPDAELTEHIRNQACGGILVPDTDEETAIRAVGFMLDRPAGAGRTAVWFPGRGRPA